MARHRLSWEFPSPVGLAARSVSVDSNFYTTAICERCDLCTVNRKILYRLNSKRERVVTRSIRVFLQDGDAGAVHDGLIVEDGAASGPLGCDVETTGYSRCRPPLRWCPPEARSTIQPRADTVASLMTPS